MRGHCTCEAEVLGTMIGSDIIGLFRMLHADREPCC